MLRRQFLAALCGPLLAALGRSTGPREMRLTCRGRLTLVGGVPIAPTDSRRTIYFHPYNTATARTWGR